MASNPLAATTTARVNRVLGRWESGTGPIYQQLASALRAAVTVGALREALPSERELAESLGVSRTTAVAAYALLADEGIIERRRGSGTYIAHRPMSQGVCPDPLDCVEEFFGMS